MKHKGYLPGLLLAFIILINCAGRDSKKIPSRITIYDVNQYYFKYKNKPVLLLGGSDEDNIFNHPQLMKDNIETLAEIGGNYIRCLMSSSDEDNLYPFFQNEDGKFNLDLYNSEYWDRFENFLRLTSKYDIIAQVEIWATHDFYRENWLHNPFNPVNNINYSIKEVRLKSEWPHHPSLKPQPFFYNTIEGKVDSTLLKYQKKFVDKLLSISLNYGNVLYVVDHDTRAPVDWAWYWANYIQQQSRSVGKEILITEMWDSWNIKDEMHVHTYGHPALFAYIDISQNNWQERTTHYNNILWLKGILEKYGGGRPITNMKVYQRRSGGRPSEPLVGLDRWWQNIFAGCAATRFHRPEDGTGLNKMSQNAIRSARNLINEFNIFECKPHPELLSLGNRGDAYCLAKPGSLYAVYFSMGGMINLRIENPDVSMDLRWFNPITGEFLKTVSIESKVAVELISPDTLQPWIVVVKDW